MGNAEVLTPFPESNVENGHINNWQTSNRKDEERTDKNEPTRMRRLSRGKEKAANANNIINQSSFQQSKSSVTDGLSELTMSLMKKKSSISSFSHDNQDGAETFNLTKNRGRQTIVVSKLNLEDKKSSAKRFIKKGAISKSKGIGTDVRKYTNGQPDAPTFDQPLRKFIEPHIAKARKAREERRQQIFDTIGCSSDHYRNMHLSVASNARVPYPSLRHERPFLFDVETHPLHQILAETIGVSDLSLLHEHPQKDKRLLMSKLLDAKSRQAFHKCYDNFVTSICIPLIHSKAMSDNLFNNNTSSSHQHRHSMGGMSGPQEICYRYQAFPSICIVEPREDETSSYSGPHCDMAYGHSIGNINFHIPLTPTFGTNALYTESHPGREDWHPLTTKSLGLGYIFDGARCLHFSLENTTEQTRVSLDFRIAICRKAKSSISSKLMLKNNLFPQTLTCIEELESDIEFNNNLCHEKILQDDYSLLPGYYDEVFLDAGVTNPSNCCYPIRKTSPRSIMFHMNKREGPLILPSR